MKKTRVLSRKCVYSNFFRIEEVVCSTTRSDEPFKRFVLDRPDSSAILLYMRSRDAIVLVHQFRAPAMDKDNPEMLELPAGIVELNESPRECIERETLEETGYSVKDPALLYTYYPSPGITSERIHIFYSEIFDTSLKESGGGVAEENEYIRVEMLPFSTIKSYMNKGLIIDGKTIMAIQWLDAQRKASK